MACSCSCFCQPTISIIFAKVASTLSEAMDNSPSKRGKGESQPRAGVGPLDWPRVARCSSPRRRGHANHQQHGGSQASDCSLQPTSLWSQNDSVVFFSKQANGISMRVRKPRASRNAAKGDHKLLPWTPGWTPLHEQAPAAWILIQIQAVRGPIREHSWAISPSGPCSRPTLYNHAQHPRTNHV